MLCMMVSICMLIIGILLIFANFYFKRERFQVNPNTLTLEKTASIKFKDTIEMIISVDTENKTGMGRIILFNRNGTIPLMISFFNLEVVLSYFEKNSILHYKIIHGIPSFKKLTISKNHNTISIYIDDEFLTSIDSKIPLNITKIRIFNSLGSFFLDDIKLIIK